jgi:hypothetical protein
MRTDAAFTVHIACASTSSYAQTVLKDLLTEKGAVKECYTIIPAAALSRDQQATSCHAV